MMNINVNYTSQSSWNDIKCRRDYPERVWSMRRERTRRLCEHQFQELDKVRKAYWWNWGVGREDKAVREVMTIEGWRNFESEDVVKLAGCDT